MAQSPVLDSNVQCVLGGSRNKTWLDDETAAASMQPGTRCRLLRASGPAGEVVLEKAESAGGACEGTWTARMQPVASGEYLVFCGNWNPFPRYARDAQSEEAGHRQALTAYLRSKGVRAPFRIRQLLRVDLEGDGPEELVAVVAGEGYSAVLLRKSIGRQVRTFAITFEKEPREDGVSEFSVPMLADLNGDGRLEIAVYGRYLKGLFTAVYEVRGTQVRKVLACACGG